MAPRKITNKFLENDYLYGKQRVWGTIGFGTTALIAGYVVDLFSDGAITYAPAFIVMLIFSICDLLACIKLKVKPFNPNELVYPPSRSTAAGDRITGEHMQGPQKPRQQPRGDHLPRLRRPIRSRGQLHRLLPVLVPGGPRRRDSHAQRQADRGPRSRCGDPRRRGHLLLVGRWELIIV